MGPRSGRKGWEAMNQTPGGPHPDRGRFGRGWSDHGDKSEWLQREELLELLWTMREKGKDDLDEILQAAEEENAELLLAAMERDGWISIPKGKVVFLEEGGG